MANPIESIVNPFKVVELRKRILFTIILLAVFRLGCFIPTPGVNGAALSEWLGTGAKGTLVGLLSLFSGGAFEKFSVFSLGVMPYISASIIFQLLTIVVPYLAELKKEGQQGYKKITQYSRYATVGIGLFQSMGLAKWIQSQVAPSGAALVFSPGFSFVLATAITMTTGTIFLMWLGEQITERGIGNGISLIISAGIVARIPAAIANTIKMIKMGEMRLFTLLIILAFIFLITAAVVILILGHRKIPIQHAKRIVGRKVYGGQGTYLPLQVNQAGVIPVIFASSLLSFPMTIGQFAGLSPNSPLTSFLALFSRADLFYNSLYAGLIIFFAFFYVAIIFNPNDVADNLRKSGGSIPGIRPGKSTIDYIEKILTRITTLGAVYLAFIAVVPFVMTYFVKGIPFYFGGTALLIVVGVTLDTVRQIESHLLMRSYEGFMKAGKLKGRRY